MLATDFNMPGLGQEKRPGLDGAGAPIDPYPCNHLFFVFASYSHHEVSQEIINEDRAYILLSDTRKICLLVLQINSLRKHTLSIISILFFSSLTLLREFFNQWAKMLQKIFNMHAIKKLSNKKQRKSKEINNSKGFNTLASAGSKFE